MAAARHLEVYAGQVVANDQYIGLLRNLFLSFRKSLLNVKVLRAVHLLLSLCMHLLIDFEHVIDRNLLLHQSVEERSLPLVAHADYQAFLKTNRNSLQFSSFTAIILAAAGILDIVAFFVVSAILSQHTPEGAELAEDFYLSHLNALGLGDSVLLLLLSPLMLLFSYTRTHRNKMPDTLIPFAGVVLIALVYIEGGYQFLLMVPDLLASADFGGLDGLIESGLGEMGDLSDLLGP